MKPNHHVVTIAPAVALIFCLHIGCSAQQSPPKDLFGAVAQKNSAAVKSLVLAGANPNVKNREGKVPLHMAVENSDMEMVRALMKFGAKATIRNRKGLSPFFLASVVKRDLALTAIMMKTKDNSTDAAPYPVVNFGSGRPVPRAFKDTASLVQWNPRFGYRFNASPDWELYAVQQDGMFKKQAIVVLNLPPTWSDVEQQEIKNAISIFAKEDDGIHTLADALSEFKKATPAARRVKGQKEGEAKSSPVAFDYDPKQGKLTYKKRTVIMFRKSITYQLDFTATPGTFDKNLPLFSAFCASIQFLDPQTPHSKKKNVEPKKPDP